jgi:hypothetical protein
MEVKGQKSMTRDNSGTVPMPNSAPKFKKLIFTVLVAAIVAALSFVLIGVYQNHKDNQPYIYTTYDSYSLLDSGSGITFKKPVEFIYQAGSNASGQVSLVHANLGAITVIAVTPGAEAVTQYKQALGNSTFKQSFDRVILTGKPAGTTVKSGATTSFTDGSIKSDAWQSDFTLTDAKKNKTLGKIIYLVGDKTFYYMIITGPSTGRQVNYSSWQQISDSIKINQ